MNLLESFKFVHKPVKNYITTSCHSCFVALFCDAYFLNTHFCFAALFMLEISIQRTLRWMKSNSCLSTNLPKDRKKKGDRLLLPFSYFSSLSSFLSSSTLPLLLPFCVLLSAHYTLIIFLCFDVWAFWNPQAVGLGMGYLIRLLCNIWWVKCWGNHVKRPDGALCIASKKGQFAAVTSVPSLNPICSNIRLCVKGVKTTKG